MLNIYNKWSILYYQTSLKNKINQIRTINEVWKSTTRLTSKATTFIFFLLKIKKDTFMLHTHMVYTKKISSSYTPSSCILTSINKYFIYWLLSHQQHQSININKSKTKNTKIFYLTGHPSCQKFLYFFVFLFVCYFVQKQ